jgi:predicted nucleic acid-binding Zn ribbon protein
VSWAEPIGKVLEQVIADLGLAKKLHEQRAVVDWADIVGENVARHSRAIRVDGGRLFVEVDSSVWAQELSLMKRRILREIGRRAGDGVVDNVHFVLGGAGTHGASGTGIGKDQDNGQG